MIDIDAYIPALHSTSLEMSTLKYNQSSPNAYLHYLMPHYQAVRLEKFVHVSVDAVTLSERTISNTIFCLCGPWLSHQL